MLVLFEQRIGSRDADVMVFRRRALRDAVLCIGWLKVFSIICYLSLYFLVYTYSQGPTSFFLQLMIIATIPSQIFLGSLLFFGALNEKPWAILMALWLCLILAFHNTVIGVIGAIFFIRTAHVTIHFLLALTFALLALSLLTVLCHDVLILYTYKKLLLTDIPTDRPPEVTADV